MPDTWNRIYARWTDGSATRASDGNVLLLEHVNGLRSLEVRPAESPGPATGHGRGWTPFAFRFGHPKDAPHSPVAPYVLAVRVFAEPADRDEFRRWLLEEHGRLQLTIAGVHWLLAYEEEGAGHSFLNLWGIDDPAIVDAGEWVETRDTAWWRRVAHVPATADRGIYRPGDVPA